MQILLGILKTYLMFCSLVDTGKLPPFLVRTRLLLQSRTLLRFLLHSWILCMIPLKENLWCSTIALVSHHGPLGTHIIRFSWCEASRIHLRLDIQVGSTQGSPDKSLLKNPPDQWNPGYECVQRDDTLSLHRGSLRGNSSAWPKTMVIEMPLTHLTTKRWRDDYTMA